MHKQDIKANEINKDRIQLIVVYDDFNSTKKLLKQLSVLAKYVNVPVSICVCSLALYMPFKSPKGDKRGEIIIFIARLLSGTKKKSTWLRFNATIYIF